MNWRPIKTAPKDEMILLRYPTFLAHGGGVVSMGRWVDSITTDEYERWLGRAYEPLPTCTGHWCISYVAIREHSTSHTKTHDARLVEVEPSHWLPLPKA